MVYDNITGARSYLGPSYPQKRIAAAARDSYALKADKSEEVLLVRDIPNLQVTPARKQR